MHYSLVAVLPHNLLYFVAVVCRTAYAYRRAIVREYVYDVIFLELVLCGDYAYSQYAGGLAPPDGLGGTLIYAYGALGETITAGYPLLDVGSGAWGGSETGAYHIIAMQNDVCKYVVTAAVGDDNLDTFTRHARGYTTLGQHTSSAS